MLQRFLIDEEGDSSAGLAVGITLVVIVVLLIFTLNGGLFAPREEPGSTSTSARSYSALRTTQ